MRVFPRIIFAIVIALPACARADAASKQRKVTEMLTLMQAQRTNAHTIEAEEARIRSLSQQQLASGALDADQQRSYTEYQKKVLALLHGAMDWKVVEPDMIKLYSDTYSEREIDGILNFYHSPAGRAMLAKEPEMNERALAVSHRRMEALSPKIQALVDEFMRQFQ